MEQIVDTNIILRYLVGDVRSQQKSAVELFQKAEKNKVKLVIKPLVVAEACFVLESFYKKERSEIADSFEVFLAQKWLTVEDRKTLQNLWIWYSNKFHFVDSYLLSWAKVNKAQIASFDKKLLKSSSSN